MSSALNHLCSFWIVSGSSQVIKEKHIAQTKQSISRSSLGNSWNKCNNSSFKQYHAVYKVMEQHFFQYPSEGKEDIIYVYIYSAIYKRKLRLKELL